MESEKKKVFFVGKTLSDESIKNVEKQFKIVKSLSKQVSILVYIPNSKGSLTQLDKTSGWDIEKITFIDFFKKYIPDDEESSKKKLNSNDDTSSESTNDNDIISEPPFTNKGQNLKPVFTNNNENTGPIFKREKFNNDEDCSSSLASLATANSFFEKIFMASSFNNLMIEKIVNDRIIDKLNFDLKIHKNKAIELEKIINAKHEKESRSIPHYMD